MRLRWLSAALLAGTFVLGAAAGVGVGRWRGFEPHEHMPPFGPWPLQKLDLSPEQRDQVHAVFERHRPALDAILRESFPRVRAVQDEIDREIRELLTPEQRVALDRMEPKGFPGPRRPGPFGGPPGPPPFGGPPPGFIPDAPPSSPAAAP
jgi:Spy/CpxP family protein refolding chaperone